MDANDVANLTKSSVLFSIPPINVGRATVESLSSFLLRLSEAHSVSLYDLLKFVLHHHFCGNTTQILTKSWWVFISGTINGLSETTVKWTNVFAHLTCQNSLPHMTFVPWHGIISQRALLRSIQVYCPYCLQERIESDQTVFYPLLWSIRLVEVCGKHRTKLFTRCHHQNCGKSFYALSSRAILGYCPACNKWLGLPTKPEQIINDNDYLTEQLWIIDTISELIKYESTFSVAEIRRPASIVSELIDTYGDGKGQRLSKIINVHHKTVYNWRDGTHLPTLQMWLRISAKLGLPLLNLLSSTNTSRCSNIDTSGMMNENDVIKQQTFNTELIKQYLIDVLSEGNPRSMRQVASSLCYDQSHLCKHFPNLCKQISSAHQEWQKLQKDANQKLTRKIVRETMLNIHMRGEYPSHKRIASVLGGIMRDPIAQETRRSVLAELGYQLDV